MNRFGECDVLIVGRGGGSLEELWAFNEEAVARAIAGSAIPVISAVGHETDYTIADFAADLRAATPTAAAELAVPHVAELGQRLNRLNQRLAGAAQSKIKGQRERLERALRSPFFRYPRRYLLDQAQRLDRLQEQLRQRTQYVAIRERARLGKMDKGLAARHPGEKIAFSAKRLGSAKRQLELAASALIKEKKQRLHGGIRQLDALSPLKVMARGYGLIYDGEGQRLLKSVSDAAPGDDVTVKLADGAISCRVLEVKGD
jgi:exodeoxyribonuclease VII large subunit